MAGRLPTHDVPSLPLRASPFRYQVCLQLVSTFVFPPFFLFFSLSLSFFVVLRASLPLPCITADTRSPLVEQVGGHSPCARVRHQSLVCKPVSTAEREHRFYEQFAPEALREFLPRYYGVRLVEFVADPGPSATSGSAGAGSAGSAGAGSPASIAVPAVVPPRSVSRSSSSEEFGKGGAHDALGDDQGDENPSGELCVAGQREA